MIAIRERMENLIKLYTVPGVAVINLNGSGEITINTAGNTRRTDIAKFNGARPITSTTLFQLASVSKMLTAWLVVELAEQNILKLDQKYHLQILEGSALEGVTLRQVLCHRGGFSKNIGFAGEATVTSENSDRVVADRCVASFNTNTIGSFQYSGCSYWFVQQVLEQLLDQRFNDLLQQWICRPCGMVHTTTTPPNEDDPFVARGHDTNGTELIGGWRKFPAVEAAAGIWTSAADISYLLQSMLPVEENLKQTSCLTDATNLVDSEFGNGYHLGVLVNHTTRGVLISHKGVNPGYQAVVRMNLQRKTACVILSNKEGCDAACNPLMRDAL